MQNSTHISLPLDNFKTFFSDKLFANDNSTISHAIFVDDDLTVLSLRMNVKLISQEIFEISDITFQEEGPSYHFVYYSTNNVLYDYSSDTIIKECNFFEKYEQGEDINIKNVFKLFFENFPKTLFETISGNLLLSQL